MARLRSDFLNGTLSALATNVATSLTSAAFANLPVVSGGDDLTLVLDPLGSAGAPEVVQVTAHTAGNQSVTVVRGREGTSARQHASGVAWRHTATSADFITVCTSSTRPTTGLYEGRMIYETDTDRVAIYNGSAWIYRGPLGVLGYAERATVTDQVVTAGVLVTGLSVAATVGASRRVRVTAKLNSFSNTAEPTTDSVMYSIREGAANLQQGCQNVNSASENVMQFSVVLTPSAGSHTYTVFGERHGGGGVISCRSTVTQTIWLLVEDIGPA